MAQKPTTTVRSASSQRDQRWPETIYDQHKSARFPTGRPWWGYAEYTNEKQHDPGFIGELMPGDTNDPHGSSWTAPWLPEQVMSVAKQYYRIDWKQRKLTWLYGTIIAEDRAAVEQYYEAAAQIAYTKGWPAPGFGEPVSYQIRMILRRPPRSPKIAEAAQAGDQWILGHTDQVNEHLAEILAGIRPDTLLSSSALTPEQVLAKPDDLEERIAKAVAAALEAKEQQDALKRGAKMAGVRAARKPKAA